MNLSSPAILVAMGVSAGILLFMWWTSLGREGMSTSSQPTNPDERRFYASLGSKNREVRPTRYSRQYYYPDDPRVPERIRIPVARAFISATRAFPLTFSSSSQPALMFASGETEGGMPHTLGNWVILPLREGLDAEDPSRLQETMTHELCHIHQRQHPSMWEDLYLRLGFKKVPFENTPSLLDGDNIVANPDAGIPGMPDIGWWSYKGQIGCLMFNPGATSLRDYTSVVIPIVPDAAADATNHLKERFGGLCPQYDHPNEISACLIANHWDDIVRGDVRIARRESDDPRWITRVWLKEQTTPNVPYIR